MILRSQSSISIDRSIQDVYQFVAVDFFENYRRWAPEVCELENLSRDRMQVGVTGRQVRYDGGYRSEALFRVTHFTPLRELRFISLSKPDFSVRYLFESEGLGARLTFSFQIDLTLLMLPFRSRIAETLEAGARRNVKNVKTLLESNVPVLTTEAEDSAAGTAARGRAPR
jgi:hypothetical protein